MRIIDIDRLKMVDDHIHYRKEYEGSAVLMDKMAKAQRHDIYFSIEYKPIGEPEISVKFVNKTSFPVDDVIPKLKQRITKLDKDGVLASLHKK